MTKSQPDGDSGLKLNPVKMNPLNGTDLKGGRVLELVGLFERGLNPSNQDLDLSNQETDPSSHKSDPSNHDSDSGKDSGSESPQSSNRSEKEFSDVSPDVEDIKKSEEIGGSGRPHLNSLEDNIRNNHLMEGSANSASGTNQERPESSKSPECPEPSDPEEPTDPKKPSEPPEEPLMSARITYNVQNGFHPLAEKPANGRSRHSSDDLEAGQIHLLPEPSEAQELPKPSEPPEEPLMSARITYNVQNGFHPLAEKPANDRSRHSSDDLEAGQIHVPPQPSEAQELPKPSDSLLPKKDGTSNGPQKNRSLSETQPHNWGCVRWWRRLSPKQKNVIIAFFVILVLLIGVLVGIYHLVNNANRSQDNSTLNCFLPNFIHIETDDPSRCVLAFMPNETATNIYEAENLCQRQNASMHEGLINATECSNFLEMIKSVQNYYTLISPSTFQDCPDESLGLAAGILKSQKISFAEPQEDKEASISLFRPKKPRDYTVFCIRVKTLS